MNSEGNLINIPKPLKTTESVQKQYLNIKAEEISKISKEKSPPKTQKPQLIFAEPSSQQFGIPKQKN